MKQDRHSETAEGTAAVRVVATRTGGDARLFSDPYAHHFLIGKYRVGRWLARAWPGLVRRLAAQLNPGAMSYIAVRYRCFDDAVSAAIAGGVGSVVLLGAGFDARAFRLAAPGLTFYEIDHPLTQRAKRKVVDAHGWLEQCASQVVYTPADFERAPLPDILAKIPGERAIIVWEGVAWYLSEDAVRETLTALSAHFAPGTELVFDAIDPDVASGERRDRVAAKHRASCERSGEPIRWGIDAAQLDEFLRSCGWSLVDVDTPTAAAERLADPRGRPFTRLGQPMPFFSLVKASIPAR